LLLFVLSSAQEPVQQAPRRMISEKRLLRVEESIVKRREKGLRKIRKYHKKIDNRINKTLKILTKTNARVAKKASEMTEKLTSYGTRKLQHLQELIDMADEDIKDRLKPIMENVEKEMKAREKLIKVGIQQLVNVYGGVFARTSQQVVKAKQIGDANDIAAEKALHLYGDKMVEGLKGYGAEGLKSVRVKELRKAKRISKDTEKRIYQTMHEAERQEVGIIKKADHLLKEMKHKARKMFAKLRRENKRAYRKLFRKASVKMMHVLFNRHAMDDY